MQKLLLLTSLIYYSSVWGQCPSTIGSTDTPSQWLSDSSVAGFKISVPCTSTVTGVSFWSGSFHNQPAVFGLYQDDNNRPTVLVASTVPANDLPNHGQITVPFASPVTLPVGNYWLLLSGQVEFGGCLGCGSQQLAAVFGQGNIIADLSSSQIGYFGVGQIGFSASINIVTGTPCPDGVYECVDSTQNYQFVYDNNGYCACKSGFSGLASVDSKCFCDTSSGNQLAWDSQNLPHCLAPGVCQAGNDFQQQLCASYSANWNYVSCNTSNGRCQCNPTFQGSATASDPCTCSGTVDWSKSPPVCNAK